MLSTGAAPQQQSPPCRHLGEGVGVRAGGKSMGLGLGHPHSSVSSRLSLLSISACTKSSTIALGQAAGMLGAGREGVKEGASSQSKFL